MTPGSKWGRRIPFRLFGNAKAHIRRMVCPHEISYDLADIAIKCRNIDAHSLKGKQRAVVFDSMMSATHDSVSVPAAITDEDYRHAVQADIVPNLLKSARIEKRRNAIYPRTKRLFRKTGCHGDHVLLRDPGIDEALPHLLT